MPFNQSLNRGNRTGQEPAVKTKKSREESRVHGTGILPAVFRPGTEPVRRSEGLEKKFAAGQNDSPEFKILDGFFVADN